MSGERIFGLSIVVQAVESCSNLGQGVLWLVAFFVEIAAIGITSYHSESWRECYYLIVIGAAPLEVVYKRIAYPWDLRELPIRFTLAIQFGKPIGGHVLFYLAGGTCCSAEVFISSICENG